MINLPQAAIEHFNTRSEEMLKLVTRFTLPKKAQIEPESSLKHKKPILTFSNVNDMILVGKHGQCAVQRKDYLFGFLSEEAQTQFGAFVEMVTKRKELSTNCSNKIISDTCFKWFIRKSEEPTISDFASFMIQELNNSCKDYMFFFPVLYLEIEHSFNIGKVQIDFLTESTIEGFKNSNLIRAEDIESFKKEYSGQVNASITIGQRDSSKAESIALQSCSFALDVLKMFGLTVDDPLIPCDFGLESRVNFNPRSNPMSLELETVNGEISGKSLQILLRSHARPFMITQKSFQRMLQNGFGIVSNFLAEPNRNELGELTLQSITFFADAISNKNLHKRIVELFTIVESFLVKNENEPILNSITKYFPKVVSRDPQDRNIVKEMLNELYAVRSATIHHGKQNGFDLNKLALLQQAIRIFIINMIEIGKKHNNKNSFLTEIDNAINAAY